MSEPRRTIDPRRYLGAAVVVVLLLVLIALPFYVDEFWLHLGLVVFAAGVGAIGLNLLTGTTGQLSLAHAFFLAVGAYGYAVFGSESYDASGTTVAKGFGLPPLIAMILAVALAGFAGLLFSPIAGRLRGIYLGLASLSLVFIGQHILRNVDTVTGGEHGRPAAPFSLFGFTFTDDDTPLTVLGVAFGQAERLWYLGLAFLALSYLFARNLLRGRPGLALQTIRDSEIAAAAMGVNVQRYKAAAFVVSSMYAGLAGVLTALALDQVEPDQFNLVLSITYLVMIVIGGLGSVPGAVVGAAFVTAMPLVLSQYADSIGFLSQSGQGGVGPGEFSNYVYGGLVILVIILAPGGLAGLFRGRIGQAARTRALGSGPALDTAATDESQLHDPTGSASSVTSNKEVRN